MKKIISSLKKIATWLCVFTMSCSFVACKDKTRGNGDSSNTQSGAGAQVECTQHNFGDWVTVYRETCKFDGLKERTCTICGETENETIAAGHTVADNFYQYASKHVKECLFCGTVFEEEEHQYVESVCVTCGYENKPVWAIADNVIEIEEGRDARILFLADTQIIDSSQMRTPTRLYETAIANWAPNKMEENCFKYIEDAINKVQPDLIIMLGDIVYGEFDDAGTSLTALINEMESYQIPWAPLYGNHENESKKGAKWQNQMLEEAEYCLFKKGETDGNGNYTIAIKQGEELVRMFYIMDSNHCKNAYNPEENGVITTMGFTNNQIVWLYNKMEAIKTACEEVVPTSLCYHVPSQEFVFAEEQYSSQSASYTIGSEVQKAAGSDDFGSNRFSLTNQNFAAASHNGEAFLSILKKFGVDTVFSGHVHKANTSITYEGIRWTFGLKTGTYDSYNSGELGGTQMLLNANGYSVKHIYYDATMQAKMDALRMK
ncbi:MAG: metallophosphoesterase [Clostridia bacterium]|nr:metallophosphoesterase [Clostridia bacterium]